jgi:hypothetical protein
MARPIYSQVLANVPSVSDAGAVLGAPGPGEVWVVRAMFATFGSYLGYVRAAIALEDVGTRQWLCTSSSSKLFGDAQQTFYWEGRYVVPSGVNVVGIASDGDTCDIKLDGYVLTSAPS